MKNGIASRMCGNIRIASSPNSSPRDAVVAMRDSPYAAMVPMETEIATVHVEITALLIRKCQNPLSTHTCQWNSNVGVKISVGGTENASTGCLIEIITPQITGIRFTAVN